METDAIALARVADISRARSSRDALIARRVLERAAMDAAPEDPDELA